ncbi:uncharacterized protein LOC131157045 isoform X2 [Malania oleifera]|uniref:uncharacterized protein LOC131157045 isoform X2 n=1 Tax=Malania oleifera TaxID=397392 RepID=UPI0025AE17E5|nr:uncharacterized protein LOC131157045 isoform X2 [Malania oleifera]
MVQMMSSSKVAVDADLTARRKAAQVKLELEDSLVEEEGPMQKRSKRPSTEQQYNFETSAFPIPPSQYNPLDEPSPLGLRLKKSPSLLDLIQMRLSQENASKLATQGKKEHGKGPVVSIPTDKLKASNFSASLLRIGAWEYASRYEGDLVAKCYFAKHKLVWEVLDGGLKNKIEIQWSDIMDIKANCPDDGPATLDVVLARQPLFFRETNPQPRKHTLWQATSDFTGGQASIQRRHFLQCPQGLLGKHFEKLIQCDPRLNFLSQQPDVVLESPYFETRVSVFEDPDESKCHNFHLKNEEGSAFYGLQDSLSPAPRLSSLKNEQHNPIAGPPGHLSHETSSPSSGVDLHAVDENGSSATEGPKQFNHCEQIKFPRLHPSISMCDLVNHIGHCISEQFTSGNPIFSIDELPNKDILEEITQYLFSDSQFMSASDEQSIMSRVNSLCCLLQKDPIVGQNLLLKRENDLDVPSDRKIDEPDTISEASESNVAPAFPASQCESNDVCFKQAPSMSRKDSVGELLLSLPRIASLPQFLFNNSEDNNQAR